MRSRQLKIACNAVVNEEDFLGDFLFHPHMFVFYNLPNGCSAFYKKSSHFIYYLDSLLNSIGDFTICLKLSSILLNAQSFYQLLVLYNLTVTYILIRCVYMFEIVRIYWSIFL